MIHRKTGSKYLVQTHSLIINVCQFHFATGVSSFESRCKSLEQLILEPLHFSDWITLISIIFLTAKRRMTSKNYRNEIYRLRKTMWQNIKLIWRNFADRLTGWSDREVGDTENWYLPLLEKLCLRVSEISKTQLVIWY